MSQSVTVPAFLFDFSPYYRHFNHCYSENKKIQEYIVNYQQVLILVDHAFKINPQFNTYQDYRKAKKSNHFTKSSSILHQLILIPQQFIGSVKHIINIILYLLCFHKLKQCILTDKYLNRAQLANLRDPLLVHQGGELCHCPHLRLLKNNMKNQKREISPIIKKVQERYLLLLSVLQGLICLTIREINGLCINTCRYTKEKQEKKYFLNNKYFDSCFNAMNTRKFQLFNK
ncbi:hypothetical protein FGO68_gene8119 [Halteria grandinella]|uniref:Uncharacterized protein n=1 Tax=Halteria grandinella TaxID=5974 RepID=A0A8J8NHW1_HALGN|nr:hypothetical protein FGO68_gene8119 [Halteria grandinella]